MRVDLALAEPRPCPPTRPRSAAGLRGAIDCDELQRHGRAQLPVQEGAAKGQEGPQGAPRSSSPRSRRHSRARGCACGSTRSITVEDKACERTAALVDSRSQRLFRTPHLLSRAQQHSEASNRPFRDVQDVQNIADTLRPLFQVDRTHGFHAVIMVMSVRSSAFPSGFHTDVSTPYSGWVVPPLAILVRFGIGFDLCVSFAFPSRRSRSPSFRRQLPQHPPHHLRLHPRARTQVRSRAQRRAIDLLLTLSSSLQQLRSSHSAHF